MTLHQAFGIQVPHRAKGEQTTQYGGFPWMSLAMRTTPGKRKYHCFMILIDIFTASATQTQGLSCVTCVKWILFANLHVSWEFKVAETDQFGISLASLGNLCRSKHFKTLHFPRVRHPPALVRVVFGSNSKVQVGPSCKKPGSARVTTWNPRVRNRSVRMVVQ